MEQIEEKLKKSMDIFPFNKPSMKGKIVLPKNK